MIFRSLQGWHPRARVAAHSVALTTWDYRTLEQRRAEAAADSPGADLAGTFEVMVSLSGPALRRRPALHHTGIRGIAR